MLRTLLAIVAVAALAAPAMGYTVIWDGDQNGVIDIELQIDCYIQIDRQDCDIAFTDQSPYDWWSTQLTGLAYAKCPDDDSQHPMYSWAGDQWYAGANGRFYESDDGAVIYVRSNNELTMNVQTNGDLAGTINDPNNTIPTWFTIAMCPFVIDDVAVSGHTVPFCGNPGCYLSDANSDHVFEICDGSHDFPSQYAFACAPASQVYTTGTMDPAVYGTIKFLGRIQRHGMTDPGDHYATQLNVSFTTP
jgi:hypothetical protein